MTLNEKLLLIDDYLCCEHIDPKWEEMIIEYKALLKIKLQHNGVSTDYIDKAMKAYGG